MNTHVLERTQHIPATLDEVFAFFSKAENLAKITPPWLGFRILSPAPIEMREGTLIDYRIAFAGIPMRWQTLISRWEPPFSFVDEQISGPYARWVHTHWFESVADGTIMRDRVEYALPLGALGDVAHAIGVKRSLKAIFDFRERSVRARFTRVAA